MNNPKKKIPKKAAATSVKSKPQAQGKQSVVSDNAYTTFNIQHSIFLLAGIAVIIFICFHNSLHNQFLTDWDDWIYVSKDPYITAFTAANMHSMLFENITRNIYHPLTMLSLAVNYHFSQLSSWGYYCTNIVLHILNALLVFFLIKMLMDAMLKAGYAAIPAIPWLVAAGALLHGLHPMHVESVSWISERKDLLYSIFYFIGLIMYVRYTEGVKFRWMLYLNIGLAVFCIWAIIGLKNYSPAPLVFGILFILLATAIVMELKFKKINIALFYVMEFFLISLFSKPMAVSFPLSILVIDFLLKRDLKLISPGGKNWIYKEGKAFFNLALEKWMFFLVVVLSGVQTIFLQMGVNSLVFTNGYTVIQKFLIACYTFTMYTVKAFYPAHLNAYYPFPNITYQHYLPSVFYVMPFFALAIIVIPLYLVRKNKDIFRVVLFGLGLYFVNIVFFLQFISSGKTILSERYTYVAYFGLIFMFIYLTHWLLNYKPIANSWLIAIKIAVLLICLTFGYLCYERVKVWHNVETLWTDVAAKNDQQVEGLPYLNLANYYVDSGKFDKAYIDYRILVKLNSKEPSVYRSLAMIYGQRKQFDSSLYCFAQAVKLDSNDYATYLNRAISYSIMGKLDLALKDYNKAFSLDSTDDGLVVKRGFTLAQLGQYKDAIKDYNRLINREPKEPSNYLYRGNAYLNQGNLEMAEKDYLHLLELQPKNAECMYYLSVTCHQLSDNALAIKYANMAESAGFKLPDNYLNTLK